MPKEGFGYRMRSINLGVKVWARNVAYQKHIQQMHRQGNCQFVELYVDTQASEADRDSWGHLNVPIRLHAPHSHGGFNPALPDRMHEKHAILQTIAQYIEITNAQSVVFHPGVDGSRDEVVKQFKGFKAQYPTIFKLAILENKPRLGLKQETCQGASPEEMKFFLDALGFGFCLDFGHANCYAVSSGRDYWNVLEGFMALTPNMFHISDGDVNSAVDMHWHIGAGTFPIDRMLSYIPDNQFLVLETPHDSKETLEDFVVDAQSIRKML